MRYLIVPPDVQLVDDLTSEPLKLPNGEILKPQSFAAFVVKTLLRDIENFAKNDDQLEARARIREKVREALPGTVLAIESTDWELLKAAAKSPTLSDGRGSVSKGYLPEIGEQILPFIHAIKDASEKPILKEVEAEAT